IPSGPRGRAESLRASAARRSSSTSPRKLSVTWSSGRGVSAKRSQTCSWRGQSGGGAGGGLAETPRRVPPKISPGLDALARALLSAAPRAPSRLFGRQLEAHHLDGAKAEREVERARRLAAAEVDAADPQASRVVEDRAEDGARQPAAAILGPRPDV